MSSAHTLTKIKRRPKQITTTGRINKFLGVLVTLHEDQQCQICGKTLKKGSLAIRKFTKYHCPHSHKKRVN